MFRILRSFRFLGTWSYDIPRLPSDEIPRVADGSMPDLLPIIIIFEETEH